MGGQTPDRLVGWKAIGAFLGRDERTAKRWEVMRGLPVRRLPGAGRAAVWADTEELNRWMQGSAAEGGSRRGEDNGLHGKRRASAPVRSWWIVGISALALTIAGSSLLWHASPGQALSIPYGDDPVARDLYRKGMFAWNRRTPAGLKEAIALFEEVAQRHPARPDAFAKLADSYLLMREFGTMPENEAYARARAQAERALKLDATSPGALRSLAFVRFWRDGDDRALALFRRAIALDPASAQGHFWYANALASRHRFASALEQYELALTIDPGNEAIVADRGFALLGAGRTDEARRTLQQLVALDPESMPAHRYLGRVWRAMGQWRPFLDETETAARLRGDNAEVNAVESARQALAERGQAAMFDRLAKYAEARWRQSGAGLSEIVLDYRLGGDEASAARWLAIGEQKHDPEMRYIRESLP